MRYLRRTRPEPGIDVSPLVDVVFILLIFFMVATTFRQEARLGIERPTATSGERSAGNPLRIGLDRHGDLVVEGRPVSRWMLQARLRELLELSPDVPVLIVADRRAPVEDLVEVVDQARLAGARDVAVATQPEGR